MKKQELHTIEHDTLSDEEFMEMLYVENMRKALEIELQDIDKNFMSFDNFKRKLNSFYGLQLLEKKIAMLCKRCIEESESIKCCPYTIVHCLDTCNKSHQ